MRPPFMAQRLLFFLMAWLVLAPAQAEGVVHLIASEAGGAYREVVDAFRDSYKSPRQVRFWVLAELGAGQIRALSSDNDLIVPIGLKAARAVAEQHGGQASVLTLMVPHVTTDQLNWPASLPGRKLAHVHIDQPVSRTLNLVELAFPLAKRLGLVISAENIETARQFQQEAERRRLNLKLERVASPEELAPALRNVLPESDILLLVPDSIAFHAGNARNVLLTTYRHRVPVVGFSEGLSRAGAVAVVYSSPAQIGRQGARMATRWRPESGDLPPSQHADEFSVAFNFHVARSLGVALPDLAEARRKLGASVEP